MLIEIDPLTGILNRRSFAERGEHEWSRSLRYEIPLSAIMFDIDFFKQMFRESTGTTPGNYRASRSAARQ